MVRHKLDSVNEFARQGYNLRIVCAGCGHVTVASAIEMMQVIAARKLSLRIDALERRLKCSRCGQRGATVSAVEREL